MTDLPRKSVQRTAKIASLPLGVAGRVMGGVGKRLVGRNADEVNAEISARTAEQLFAVLGQLKGGAMKVGQLLSVFEAAVPEEMAAPYREALTKLQSAAPPMAFTTVRQVLNEQLGSQWRQRFADFSEEPVASASIGQVHRAVYHDGRAVAVKVQYPGADDALRADLRQLQRFSRIIQALQPGVEIKPLIGEIRDRVVEELDYRVEADYQRAFATAFADDAQFVVPKVVASAPKVLVTEWETGTPLARVIADGSREDRDRAGYLLALFGFSAPERSGQLHADPHPGNFMLRADGKLVVIDFGAVARLPDGLPVELGLMTRFALQGDSAELMRVMREARFVREDVEVRAEAVYAYLAPFVEPLRVERFHFTRTWLRTEADRLADFRSEENRAGRMLNLPPHYVLVHRVLTGIVGILCQLDADIPLLPVVRRWQPGFDPDAGSQQTP